MEFIFAHVSGEKMTVNASDAIDFTSKFPEIIKTEELKVMKKIEEV